MIISPGRKYIFVHIPKTGGTSLALALEARAQSDDILIGDTPKATRRKRRLRGAKTAGRLWKHSSLMDVDGLIDPANLQGWMVFTLVRNPWDRIASYYYWLRQQDFDNPAVRRAKSKAFSGFLNDPATIISLSRQPYASYVSGPDGTCRADHFVRIEEWQQDMEPVWDHLGFRFALPKVNASGKLGDYRHLYSEADAALVAKIAAADVARSGYRFDPTA